MVIGNEENVHVHQGSVVLQQGVSLYLRSFVYIADVLVDKFIVKETAAPSVSLESPVPQLKCWG